MFHRNMHPTTPSHILFFAIFTIQAKQNELEDLNKELRQCNLQQFIQQTGVLPAHTNSRAELQEHLEQLELAPGIMHTTHPVRLYNGRLVIFWWLSPPPLRPQCYSRGISASSDSQTVSRTSTEPAKPSSVQSQPWGCVCVRPCCFPCLHPLVPVPLAPHIYSNFLGLRVAAFNIGGWF